QRVPLALGAGAEQELAHGRAETHADGGHVAADELHDVVDGHAGCDRSAGRVDVEPDFLGRVLALEVQQLGDDEVGRLGSAVGGGGGGWGGGGGRGVVGGGACGGGSARGGEGQGAGRHGGQPRGRPLPPPARAGPPGVDFARGRGPPQEDDAEHAAEHDER